MTAKRTVYEIEYAVVVTLRVVTRDGEIVSTGMTADHDVDVAYPYRAAVVAGVGDDPEFIRYPEWFGEDKFVIDHLADRQLKATFKFGKDARRADG